MPDSMKGLTSLSANILRERRSMTTPPPPLGMASIWSELWALWFRRRPSGLFEPPGALRRGHRKFER